MKILLKREKKWTWKIQMSKIVILVLNQFPISAVFPIKLNSHSSGVFSTGATGALAPVILGQYYCHSSLIYNTITLHLLLYFAWLWIVKPKENSFLLKLLASKGKETPSISIDGAEVIFLDFLLTISSGCLFLRLASPWKITGRAREKLRHYYTTVLGFTIYGRARQFYYLKHYAHDCNVIKVLYFLFDPF